MGEESPKPSGFLETVGVAPASGRRPSASLGDAGGRPRLTIAPSPRATADGQEPLASRRAHSRRHGEPDDSHLKPLVREWLVELRMMGRSPRTIEWYRQKMDWYLSTGQAQSLQEFTAYELKRYLGELRDRDLADNTIHGFFEVLRAFASWADREGYPVDPALLRVRAPKVEQKEVETYTREQLETIFGATPLGWPMTAVKILLGTGMRLSELCGLIIEDFEDDGESAFLKVRHGQGGKVSSCPGQQPAPAGSDPLPEPLAAGVAAPQPPP